MINICVWIFSSLYVAFATAQAPGLLEALTSAGASKFAAGLKSDPTLLNIALSDQVQTIFAVVDHAYGTNRKRQLSPSAEGNNSYQFSSSLSNTSTASQPPGIVIPTQDNSATLGSGKNQNVVSDTRNGTANDIAKRGLTIFQQQSPNTTLSVPLKIFSGLGNYVSIVQGDVVYQGGLIQITDGFFTIPVTLSATNLALGHTSFTTLTDASNLTAELDTTAGITAFVPTNAAFAIAKVSGTDPTTPSLMDGHIVPNFVGYVPVLTNGAELITQAGLTVTVTVQGNNIFINNAKIIASNVILENGVAHVLDQVIDFSAGATPAPVPTLVSSVLPTLLGGPGPIVPVQTDVIITSIPPFNPTTIPTNLTPIQTIFPFPGTAVSVRYTNAVHILLGIASFVICAVVF